MSCLIVCTSMKPALGRHQRSAVRTFCEHIFQTLKSVDPNTALCDLREDPLPFFDGRLPLEHDHPAVKRWLDRVGHASCLYLGVPAYWGLPSGAAKNWLDVLSGPAYDLSDSRTVFDGKAVGIFVVGARDGDAEGASSSMHKAVEAVGMRLSVPPLLLDNPRSAKVNWNTFGQQLTLHAGQCLRSSFV